MARPPDLQARERLLQAARHEFVEHGLDAAKVESITRRAGLSKGAFYLHFKTKPEVFEVLMHSVMGRLGELLSEALSLPPVSGPEQAEEHLERWVEADLRMFEFLLEQRDLVALVLEGGGSGSTQCLVPEFCSQVEIQIATFLRQGIAIGLYRSDLNIEMASAFMAGGYDRAARRLIEDPRQHNLPELIRQWQRQAIAGIGTPELIAIASPAAKTTTSKRLLGGTPKAAPKTRKMRSKE